MLLLVPYLVFVVFAGKYFTLHPHKNSVRKILLKSSSSAQRCTQTGVPESTPAGVSMFQLEPDPKS